MDNTYQFSIYDPRDNFALKVSCNNKEFLTEFGMMLNKLYSKFNGRIEIEMFNIESSKGECDKFLEDFINNNKN